MTAVHSRLAYRGALLLAVYAGLTWTFRAKTLYNIGFINCVLTEQGARAFFEYAHPLHVPLLSALHRFLVFLGSPGVHIAWYQAVSLLFSCAAVFLVWKLLKSGNCGDGAAIAGALAAGLSSSFWPFATQTTAYPAALCFLLLSFYFLANEERWSGLFAGAALGISAGFTLATLAALPVEAWHARRQMRLAPFLQGFAVGFAAAWLPMLALHGAGFAPGAGTVAFWQRLWTVPGGPLTSAPSLRQQLAVFFSGSGFDAFDFWLLLPSVFLLGRSVPAESRSLSRMLTGCLASFFLFFILVDAANRFKYVLFVLALLALVPRVPPSRRGLAVTTLAVLLGLQTFAAAVYPDWREEDPLSAEGRFLSGYLRGGLVLCGGPPDWRMRYFHRDLDMVRADLGKDERDPFDTPLLAPGPELAARVAQRLRAGGRVVLAADRLFQMTEEWSRAEIDVRQDEAYRFVIEHFDLKTPLISPLGQRYYPLALKRRRRIGP